MLFKNSNPFGNYILPLDGVTDNCPFSLPSGSVISPEGRFCFPSGSVTCREGRFCFSSGSVISREGQFCFPSGSVISREGQFCFPSGSESSREGQFCFPSGSARSFHPTQSGRSPRRGCGRSSTTISPHDVMTIFLILPNLFAFFFACVEEKAYLCKAKCPLWL